MTTDTAPDAGHAAETVSDAQVISDLIESAMQLAYAKSRNAFASVSGRFTATDNEQGWRDLIEFQRTELLRRLKHTAPARTAGTETGGES